MNIAKLIAIYTEREREKEKKTSKTLNVSKNYMHIFVMMNRDNDSYQVLFSPVEF